LTDESVSTRTTAGETTVGLEDLGSEDASGSVDSPALGDSTSAVSAGLCAVGLADEDAPAQFNTDEEDRVEVQVGVYDGPDADRGTASDVVRSCGRVTHPESEPLNLGPALPVVRADGVAWYPSRIGSSVPRFKSESAHQIFYIFAAGFESQIDADVSFCVQLGESRNATLSPLGVGTSPVTRPAVDRAGSSL